VANPAGVAYATRNIEARTIRVFARNVTAVNREVSMTHVERVPAANTLVVAHKLDAVAWGLFFVWVGVALLANTGWGLGFLGVGVITLGGQLARKYFSLGVERFWVVVGLLFVLGGVWELLVIQLSLVPMVLIVAGVALLLSAMRG
jgi:predicted phage tail protein